MKRSYASIRPIKKRRVSDTPIIPSLAMSVIAKYCSDQILYNGINSGVTNMNQCFMDQLVQRESILIECCVLNDVAMVKNILKTGVADPSAQNNLALTYAVHFEHLEIIKLLLEDGRADPSVPYTLLYESIKDKKWEIINLFLIDKRFDPTCYDCYLLQRVVRSGCLSTMKLLLQDKRVDPTWNNNYAINCAVASGYLEMFKLLMADERINIDYHYLLNCSAERGHVEIVELLLARLDPNNLRHHDAFDTAYSSAILTGHQAVTNIMSTSYLFDMYE